MDQLNSKTVSKNIMWNTIGSLFYLVCQWLLSVVVVLFSGYSDAGVLSVATSVAAIFAIVAFFNVRQFQASDSTDEFSSGDYVLHRLITCGVTFLACAIFVLISSYDLYTSISILGYMLVKEVEAFADVLHGDAQKKWRLDIAGKSFIIRGVLLIGSFSLVLYFSGNLPLALSISGVSVLIPLIFYDKIAVSRLTKIEIKPSKKNLLALTKICLPMVGYGMCINSVMPLARCVIEVYHGEEVLGYYASVSTVAILVQALMNLISTPLIGVFDNAYRKNDKRAMVMLLVKLTLLLVLIVAVAFACIAFLGEWAMSLVFGEEIIPYVYLLYPTVIASCLIALVWILGMILVIMRMSVSLLGGALAGIVLCGVLAFTTIPSMCYDGANLTMIASLALMVIVYLVRFLIYLFSKKSNFVEGKDM